MSVKIKETDGMICVHHRQCWNKGEKISEGWHVYDLIQSVKADSSSSVDDALEKLVQAREKRAAEPDNFPDVGHELDCFFTKMHWILQSTQDRGWFEHIEIITDVCKELKKEMREYFYIEGEALD